MKNERISRYIKPTNDGAEALPDCQTSPDVKVGTYTGSSKGRKFTIVKYTGKVNNCGEVRATLARETALVDDATCWVNWIANR